jgi:signal transduction histidine kinase
MRITEKQTSVLIIDDDPALLKSQTRLLDEAGFEVHQAASGEEGLALARKVQPDLVLLDIMLPDTNGYLICEMIKSDPLTRDAYVILVSGLKIDSRDQAKGLELGADGYLVRPISNRELVARVIALSRLKETEKKLRKTQADLEQSNQDLQQFAYAISHDLQEPLRMITSFLNLLEKRSRDKLDENDLEYIDFAVDGAERMREMIDGILRFSRVTTRGDEFQSFSSQAACRNAVENLKMLIEESGAQVGIGELPELIGDEMQITQVFQNLISNGIKFNRSDAPEVTIRAEDSPGQRVYAVQDNGIGIQEKAQDRIFTIYQRLHTQDEYPGAGVGLTICKRIIQRHGGRIWVESNPGEGSTFYFSIPKKISDMHLE